MFQDNFEARCGYAKPEASHLPIAFLACAALFALIALGGPAWTDSETDNGSRQLPAPVAQR